MDRDILHANDTPTPVLAPEQRVKVLAKSSSTAESGHMYVISVLGAVPRRPGRGNRSKRSINGTKKRAESLVWNADSHSIIADIRRGSYVLESIH